MSFKTMSISKKIIIGYAVFFIILIFISAFVTVQNVLSLNSANTLSQNDESNMAVQEALNHFLNARVSARVLMMSDSYADDVYTTAKSELDDCVEHLNDGLTLAKENNMAQSQQLLSSAIENLKKYEALLEELHTTNRNRASNKDALPALGRQTMDALDKVVSVENEAIRAEISSGNSNLLRDYDNFYAFTSVKLQLYNARLLSTRLSYLSDITSYDSIMAAIEDCKTSLNTYRETIPATRRAVVDEALDAMNVYADAFVINRDLLAKTTEQSNNLISTNESIQETLGEASTVASSALSDMVDTILSSARITLWVIIVMLIIAVLVNLGLAITIVTSINKALGNAMAKLTETTASVVSASGELLSAAGSLAQGGSEQAAAIEQTSATMNETASMVQQNTENTREAALLANETVNAAMKGVNEMQTLIEFMDKLSKSSGEIGKIVDDINTIAFQTNILALNASVEAVRAGEAGRSFSVVAEEVRRLSQNSADAANNTAAIISENIDLSSQSVQNSKGVGETLTSISASIQKVNNFINEISSASEEQSRGVQQINIALSQMEKVTQSSAAISQQSAAAANELMNQANYLERITDEIRLLAGN